MNLLLVPKGSNWARKQVAALTWEERVSEAEAGRPLSINPRTLAVAGALIPAAVATPLDIYQPASRAFLASYAVFALTFAVAKTILSRVRGLREHIVLLGSLLLASLMFAALLLSRELLGLMAWVPSLWLLVLSSFSGFWMGLSLGDLLSRLLGAGKMKKTITVLVPSVRVLYYDPTNPESARASLLAAIDDIVTHGEPVIGSFAIVLKPPDIEVDPEVLAAASEILRRYVPEVKVGFYMRLGGGNLPEADYVVVVSDDSPFFTIKPIDEGVVWRELFRALRLASGEERMKILNMFSGTVTIGYAHQIRNPEAPIPVEELLRQLVVHALLRGLLLDPGDMGNPLVNIVYIAPETDLTQVPDSWPEINIGLVAKVSDPDAGLRRVIVVVGGLVQQPEPEAEAEREEHVPFRSLREILRRLLRGDEDENRRDVG